MTLLIQKFKCMSPRYITSYGAKYDCAVVSFMNALKFQGKRITHKGHYKKICKELGYISGVGVYTSKSLQVAKKYGFTRIYKASGNKVADVLLNGDGCLIRLEVETFDGENSGHMIFVGGIARWGNSVSFQLTGHRGRHDFWGFENFNEMYRSWNLHSAWKVPFVG